MDGDIARYGSFINGQVDGIIRSYSVVNDALKRADRVKMSQTIGKIVDSERNPLEDNEKELV